MRLMTQRDSFYPFLHFRWWSVAVSVPQTKESPYSFVDGDTGTRMFYEVIFMSSSWQWKMDARCHNNDRQLRYRLLDTPRSTAKIPSTLTSPSSSYRDLHGMILIMIISTTGTWYYFYQWRSTLHTATLHLVGSCTGFYGVRPIGWSRLSWEALPVRHYRKMLVPLTDVKYLYSLDGGIQWYPASCIVQTQNAPIFSTTSTEKTNTCQQHEEEQDARFEYFSTFRMCSLKSCILYIESSLQLSLSIIYIN